VPHEHDVAVVPAHGLVAGVLLLSAVGCMEGCWRLFLKAQGEYKAAHDKQHAVTEVRS